MIDYPIFCQLKQAQQAGLSVRQIARQLDLHEQTVALWLARDQFARSRSAERPRGSKLDEHKGAIVRWLDHHPFTAAQLFHKLKEQGYAGGYSILKDYVRRIRPRPSPAFLTLQFAAGQCAQVDWGSHGSVRVGNTRRALSFFVLVLCHSRWLYVEFTLGQSQEWFLGCHQRAFHRLGGVPHEIMVDNCKTAVLSHPVGGPPVLNPHYLDFARHHGFTIKACGPRRPQSKGRVENAVAYVKGNFLAGRELAEFAGLAPATTLWLDTVANARTHGETKRVPAELLQEEKPRLLALPAVPYEPALTRTVRVSRRCRITVEANRYSVPPAHAGQVLTLQLYSDRLRLFAATRLVAEHARSHERGRDFEQPDHVRDLLDQRKQARRQRLLVRFLALGACAQAYHQGLVERRLNAHHHVEKILALAELHGPDLIVRLIADACELGAFSCEYIANLVDQRQRLLPAPGALHLTRAGDLLELELEAPDLSSYDQTLPPATPTP
jgi:transposase